MSGVIVMFGSGLWFRKAGQVLRVCCRIKCGGLCTARNSCIEEAWSLRASFARIRRWD